MLGLDRVAASVDADGCHSHAVVDLADADRRSKQRWPKVSPGSGRSPHVAGDRRWGAAPRARHAIRARPVGPELFRASVDANLTTQFLTVRATVPHLLASGRLMTARSC